MVRLLVDSPDPGTTVYLRARLDTGRFQIRSVTPGVDFAELARPELSQIAVFDQIHKRLETVRSRIAMVKQRCPGVLIIAISGCPSPLDGTIVELGVFYYLTLGVGGELVRIIEAGAELIGRQASIAGQAGGAP